MTAVQIATLMLAAFQQRIECLNLGRFGRAIVADAGFAFDMNDRGLLPVGLAGGRDGLLIGRCLIRSGHEM